MRLYLQQAVRNVLRECYGNKDAVTDELVAAILKPGQQVGNLQEPSKDSTATLFGDCSVALAMRPHS